MNYILHLLLLSSGFLTLCNINTLYAQYVGGEVIYYDTATKTSKPAPGVRLYLIGGVHRPDKPLKDFEVLDQDLSASVTTGAKSSDVATYVLAAPKGKHTAVTILFYPWNKDGDQTTPGFLSRTIQSRVTENDNKLRAKARIDCTPTNKNIETTEELSKFINTSYKAYTLAKLIIEDDENRTNNFKKELELINSMIDIERREKIVIEFHERINKLVPPSIHNLCLESINAPNAKKVREQQLLLWSKIHETKIEQLDFRNLK